MLVYFRDELGNEIAQYKLVDAGREQVGREERGREEAFDHA